MGIMREQNRTSTAPLNRSLGVVRARDGAASVARSYKAAGKLGYGHPLPLGIRYSRRSVQTSGMNPYVGATSPVLSGGFTFIFILCKQNSMLSAGSCQAPGPRRTYHRSSYDGRKSWSPKKGALQSFGL